MIGLIGWIAEYVDDRLIAIAVVPHGERTGLNSGVVGSDFGDSSVCSVAISSVVREVINRGGDGAGVGAGDGADADA